MKIDSRFQIPDIRFAIETATVSSNSTINGKPETGNPERETLFSNQQI
jgi:hypothetical protein